MDEGHKSRGPGKAQVFEVTMHNDEDQEELNRIMRKPGESPYIPCAQPNISPPQSTDSADTSAPQP